MPVAGLLAREIQLRFGDDAVHYDVAVDAHLLAAEMEYEFALYYCKSRGGGPVWEKEDEWTASLEDESERRRPPRSRRAPRREGGERSRPADRVPHGAGRAHKRACIDRSKPDALAAVLRRRGGLAAPPSPGIAKVVPQSDDVIAMFPAHRDVNCAARLSRSLLEPRDSGSTAVRTARRRDDGPEQRRAGVDEPPVRDRLGGRLRRVVAGNPCARSRDNRRVASSGRGQAFSPAARAAHAGLTPTFVLMGM